MGRDGNMRICLYSRYVPSSPCNGGAERCMEQQAAAAFTAYLLSHPVITYSSSLYDPSTFREQYGTVLFLGQKLSKRDTEVLLKWLSRDCGVVASSGDVRPASSSWAVEITEGIGNQASRTWPTRIRPSHHRSRPRHPYDPPNPPPGRSPDKRYRVPDHPVHPSLHFPLHS